MNVVGLECSKCGSTYPANQLHALCLKCGKPLLVRYDLDKAGHSLKREMLRERPSSLWRYREILPVESDNNAITLGEGFTPLTPAPHIASKLGMSRLFVKDEGMNPTGSFKARGLCLAVSMAKELGVSKLAIASAGNAGGALAAYAAHAGLEAHILMPRDAPAANRIECSVMGARVVLIDGLITDCAAEIARRKEAEGWFDVSTLKEPYRIEGKKTMGYELAEQLGWNLPDAILYPTGGGTGLIGMWKAFDEMERMGWIGSQRPRMFSVQAVGCAPIVHAFEQGLPEAPEFKDARTVAAGLRVPRAIGDFIMLNILRSSGGGAVAVTDDEMIDAVSEIGGAEGIFCAPEGAACLPALRHLIAAGRIDRSSQVVLFNTGSGLKYLEAFG